MTELTRSKFPVVSAGAYRGEAQIGDLNSGGLMEAEFEPASLPGHGSPNPLLQLYVGGVTLQIIMSPGEFRTFAEWLIAQCPDA